MAAEAVSAGVSNAAGLPKERVLRLKKLKAGFADGPAVSIQRIRDIPQR
jgi:hypothetical protein